MSGGAADLSGRWTGMFNYPHSLPSNNFEAELRDSGGVISGVIVQPREIFEAGGGKQHAVISGSRSGMTVQWVKVYDDLGRATPHYEGIIQPGGDEIHGEWHIPGDWSGTFMMIRNSGATESVEREESVTV